MKIEVLKTNIANAIVCDEDIKSFVDFLFNQNIAFHFDDDFNDYGGLSVREAKLLNLKMQQCRKFNNEYLESYSLEQYKKFIS